MTDDDGLAWFENVLGSAAGDERPDMRDARCPRCNASDLASVPDLFSESAARLDEPGAPKNVARDGGLTDEQIVRKLVPPRQRSALGVAAAVAAPLAAIAAYVYWRFGENVGQASIVGAIVVTLVVLMTMARRFSDKYYHARRRWNHLYMCRKCGQLVGS